MASRRLEDLHPDLRPKAEELVKQCERAGYPILIYCTWRSPEEQRNLYASGRTKVGKVKTNVLVSKHNFTIDGKPAAKAFDACPWDNGHLDWDGFGPNWDFLLTAARKLGLKCGHDWLMKDSVHFELIEPKGA